MRILLTNDDGIQAPGIFALYQELKKIGKVIVVAPDSERSSVGHGITLDHPLWVKRMTLKDKFSGWGVSGTPADCVKVAVGVLLKQKPDLIVSGINLGPNDGCSVFYSGTVAGAREGALCGIPSIAISLGTFVNPDFSYAAQFGSKIAAIVNKKKLPSGLFLNVNVPAVKKAKIRGVRVCRQGQIPIHGEFRKRKDSRLRTCYWMSGKLPHVEKDPHADTFALEQNYITVVPICCDVTEDGFLQQMKGWTF